MKEQDFIKANLGEVVYMPYKRFDKNLPGLYKEDYRNAGFDVFANLYDPEVDEEYPPAPIRLAPGEVKRIPLNIATKIPFYGVGLLFQRSSTYSKWKVKLTNGVGVIDSLFCGDGDQWLAEFKNESDKEVVIEHGDKICQAVFLPLLPVVPIEVDELGKENRGGYGTSFDNARELGGCHGEKKEE